MSSAKTKKKETVPKRHSLTIAPPGCGKTYELTQRFADVISSSNLSKDDILCITFTRQAAREMKLRIRQSIILRQDELPIISTLHSFCTVALSDEGLLGEIHIIDTDERMLDECAACINVSRRASKNSDGTDKLTLSNIQLYSLFKRAGLDIPDPILRRDKERKTHKGPDQADRDPDENPYSQGMTREEFINSKITKYEDFKQRHSTADHRCIDYNDILLLMKTAIEQGEYKHRFRRIFVDEVQDLNDFQMQLIHLLLAEDGRLHFFGDPQQSIYSFMGARAEMIPNLMQECSIQSKFLNRRSSDYLVDGSPWGCPSRPRFSERRKSASGFQQCGLRCKK